MTGVEPVDPANPISRPTPAPAGALSAAAAMVEVMRRVEGIAKSRQNTDGAKFNFRGIDDVMNVVGPLLRDIGLLCIPELLTRTSEQITYGRNSTPGFRNCVEVRYRLVGPDGTSLVVGPVPGEAIDSGDKGTTKAMSVAFRTMWLQTLCVPTSEPDPDESTYQLARPEATDSDPTVVAKLRERVAAADSDAKLKSAYGAVRKAQEEDGTITVADRTALVELITARKAEVDAAAGPA